MGAESSRSSSLPRNIDDYRELIKSYWNSTKYQDNVVNNAEHTTIDIDKLIYAGYLLSNYFHNNKFTTINILEIGCGSGLASRIIYEQLTSKNNINMISTELQSTGDTSHNNIHFEYGIDSIDAVQKYGEYCNVLMMISPPPGGLETSYIKSPADITSDNAFYMDYFAVNDFYHMKKKLFHDLYVVIIGELGASDGTIGIYKYFFDQDSIWTNIYKKDIDKYKDMFGCDCTKTLYIFKNK